MRTFLHFQLTLLFSVLAAYGYPIGIQTPLQMA